MTIDVVDVNKNLEELEIKFRSKLVVNNDLNRTLVSFQANKKEPGYRWYKFKEGYSANLVKYVLNKFSLKEGKLIDPFAGSGTSLFAASSYGLDSVGIELLPIGIEIIEVRRIILGKQREKLKLLLQDWIKNKPWLSEESKEDFIELNITKGAFPEETKELIKKYLTAISKIASTDFKRVIRFALICILEEISYTRKDGQYLRWDYRSGRNQGKSQFDKGTIKDFNSSITNKLSDILEDIDPIVNMLFPDEVSKEGHIKILQGSCLKLLPKLKANEFDLLMTSPPYCNRYDYTRTYALELAILGVGEENLKELRQEMMTCTVENREKQYLREIFSTEVFENATNAFDEQEQLKTILEYLEEKKIAKELNNPGIVRMVKNYFYELSLIIFESARIIKKNGYFIMVNDNVKYVDVNIPVDLILSDIATKAGFGIEKIWVLPIGKGNSSQQMGVHGRKELRKCVYIWKKL